jgi:hypothetical protein
MEYFVTRQIRVQHPLLWEYSAGVIGTRAWAFLCFESHARPSNNKRYLVPFPRADVSHIMISVNGGDVVHVRTSSNRCPFSRRAVYKKDDLFEGMLDPANQLPERSLTFWQHSLTVHLHWKSVPNLRVLLTTHRLVRQEPTFTQIPHARFFSK